MRSGYLAKKPMAGRHDMATQITVPSQSRPAGGWPSSIGAPLVLRFGAALKRLSDAEFFEFCRLNADWRMERSSTGDLIVMAPAGGETGRRNSILNAQLVIWNDRDQNGIVYDSSTGFVLPNGATRSPDAAWMLRERWDALSSEQRKTFPPLTPDFVVELRSESDTLKALRAKMREYIECGVRLGWLIDPMSRQVEVFRPGRKAERIDQPDILSADPELPGFVLQLAQIWS
jgi:Uma2 family endonuclease